MKFNHEFLLQRLKAIHKLYTKLRNIRVSFRILALNALQYYVHWVILIQIGYSVMYTYFSCAFL